MVLSNKSSMRISRFTCANYYYYDIFAGNVHNCTSEIKVSFVLRHDPVINVIVAVHFDLLTG
jgi:hypothetical protein